MFDKGSIFQNEQIVYGGIIFYYAIITKFVLLGCFVLLRIIICSCRVVTTFFYDIRVL